MQHVTQYFSRLTTAFGQAWTRFWFTPTDPSLVSALRVLTGLVVVYLHATLSLDLMRFFGPDGLLPAVDISPLEGNTLSYMNYLYQPAELWAVHLIGLAVLILWTAGVWTRGTSILALVVFLSVVNRATVITGRTEVILAMLMLYLCIAPCGRRFSVDAWLSARKGPLLGVPHPELSTAATVATRLIQVHLALLVAMMGLSQLNSDTWWNGWGIWFLITRQQSRLVDFTWLSSTPLVIDAWTHVVVFFELTFPLLIWPRLARPIVLGLGLFVWTSLALVTGDITFALVMCIASLAFVPAEIVAGLTARAPRPVPAST